ncbi:MAG: hypothetical protein HQK76_10345 [Desulfobacterales bacterium]|nr:hypothetical protein [Desulfobacterales bacterium]
MGITETYLEMINAQVETFKAKVAVAKANAKAEKAKQEVSTKAQEIIDLLTAQLEKPFALVQDIKEKGLEIYNIIRANIITAQNEVKTVFNNALK